MPERPRFVQYSCCSGARRESGPGRRPRSGIVVGGWGRDQQVAASARAAMEGRDRRRLWALVMASGSDLAGGQRSVTACLKPRQAGVVEGVRAASSRRCEPTGCSRPVSHELSKTALYRRVIRVFRGRGSRGRGVDCPCVRLCGCLARRCRVLLGGGYHERRAAVVSLGLDRQKKAGGEWRRGNRSRQSTGWTGWACEFVLFSVPKPRALLLRTIKVGESVKG